MGFVPSNDNIIIGYKAGQGDCGAQSIMIGDHPGPYAPIQLRDADRAPMHEIHLRANDTLTIDGPPSLLDAPTFWHCAYCGQSNATEREECRSCRAPLPAEDDALEVEIRVFGDETIELHGARAIEAIRERWDEKYRGFQNGDRITVLDSRGLR